MAGEERSEEVQRWAAKRCVALVISLLKGETTAMSDSLYQGRRFRTLNILDEGVREALAIEIDTSLPAERIVRTLQQLITWGARPKRFTWITGPS